MPNLTSDATDAIRRWMFERDWDYQRLADECNTINGLDPDDWAAGGVRNAVNGYDPVRAGRINRIALVTQSNPTQSYPNGLTYDALVGNEGTDPQPPPATPPPPPEDPSQPKVERTGPPARRDGKDDRKGPPRATAHAAAGAA